MSKRNKKEHRLQPDNPYAAEGTDTLAPREVIERLHPSLRESFVPLPPAGTRLTRAQLDAVFAGDRRGLRELARLAYKSGKDAPK